MLARVSKKQELINIFKGFLLGMMVILGATALAWNGPVSNPPNHNAYTPINVSVTSQPNQAPSGQPHYS